MDREYGNTRFAIETDVQRAMKNKYLLTVLLNVIYVSAVFTRHT